MRYYVFIKGILCNERSPYFNTRKEAEVWRERILSRSDYAGRKGEIRLKE